MAKVKVYGSATSRCTYRVLATLEEVGVEYELVMIDFAAGEHKQPQHLRRNPFGQVPALQDGDLIIFESRAITRYIARKYKNGHNLLRDNNEEEQALVEVWMEVESQQYNPVIKPLISHLIFNPKKNGGKIDESAVSSYVEKLETVLDVYEESLTHNKYLAGDFFSLADIHHFTYTFLLMMTPYASLINSRPHVKAWCEELLSRPSCKKVSAGLAAATTAPHK